MKGNIILLKGWSEKIYVPVSKPGAGLSVFLLPGPFYQRTLSCFNFIILSHSLSINQLSLKVTEVSSSSLVQLGVWKGERVHVILKPLNLESLTFKDGKEAKGGKEWIHRGTLGAKAYPLILVATDLIQIFSVYVSAYCVLDSKQALRIHSK